MKSRNPDGNATEGGWLDSLYGWSDSLKEKTYALLGRDVPESKPEPETKPAKPATASYSAVKTVSNEGKPVAIPRLLVPDSVTIVDFYADWCGPCRRVSPKLELLAQQDQQVYLRKVDIVRWGTEVAQQHNIRSVPHIRVYNRNGDLVGSPTSDFDQVIEYVALAK
jgi:thioredoxin 1